MVDFVDIVLSKPPDETSFGTFGHTLCNCAVRARPPRDYLEHAIRCIV